tara:strand:+ start:368 stop:502 length:135 start_codon:yes stop_codon:yes gene_type:complete
MRTIIKLIFFIMLLAFVFLSIYALIGDTSPEIEDYRIEVEIEQN